MTDSDPDRSPGHALSYDECVRDIRALLEVGRPSDAAILLRAAVEAHPSEGYLHSLLGSALWQAGRRQEAVSAMRAASELDPDLECPRLILCHALDTLGGVDDSLEVLRQGLEDAPTRRGLWLQEIARRHLDLNRPGEAIPFLEAALREAPDDGQAMFLLAEARCRFSTPEPGSGGS